MEKIKNFAFSLKNKLKKSETEKLLDLAISSTNIPLRSVYTDLASMLNSKENLKTIQETIHNNLDSNKEINKIIRTLLLSEALCKLTGLSFSQELKKSVVRIKNLLEYYPKDRPLDQSRIVRETAKFLLDLIYSRNSENRELEPDAKQQTRPVKPILSYQTEEAKVYENKENGSFVRGTGGNKIFFEGLSFRQEKNELKEEKKLQSSGLSLNSRLVGSEQGRSLNYNQSLDLKDSEFNQNTDLLSLLTLQIGTRNPQNESNNGTVPKNQLGISSASVGLGNLSVGYNSSLFDAEFPLVIKEAKPQVDPRTLEKSLIDLDNLEQSLSESKPYHSKYKKYK